MPNRPQGREKHVTGAGKSVHRRGSGLGTGPVGPSGGHSNRPTSASSGQNTSFSGNQNYGSYGSSPKQTRAGGGGGSLILIILAAVLLFGGGGFGLSNLLGGSSSQESSGYSQSSGSQSQSSDILGSLTQGLDLSSFLGGSVGNVSSGWTNTSNVSKLSTSVDPAARAKRTKIIGNGEDTVTIMVYMCGTDLESRSGMGTSDIQEMIAADLGDKINLIIYTGGCKKWQNNVISSSYNQIYKVEKGGLRCLVQNDGTGAMTDPKTLSKFIKYCTKNYPANRNELIFWDHGGGSLSGYGYDEKNPGSGSMTLSGIDKALSSCGTTFDFIGFDACLMATLENALTLTPYADYMIASEETEPGVGWYYTNWLTALGKNTSMPTVNIGKNIVDDFVSVCGKSCAGQQTTLSVTDLAELERTIPDKFKQFAVSTSELMQNSEYKTVSDARSSTREFAASNKLDQVDLIHLAYNLDTDESRALANTLLNAVKYNNTSSNITNAYGLSIYFPYQKTSTVDTAVAAYNSIGIDSEYARCIQQFASMEVSGQAVSGSSHSPLASLQGASSGGSLIGSDMISSVLGSLLGGNLSGISGLTGGTASFLGKNLDVDSTTQYLSENRFDPSALVWNRAGSSYQLELSEEQWSLVHDIELNVFFDDGEGYIDLGLDNVFEFTDDGALIGEFDGTWLAINEQPVAYYHTGTVVDGDNYTVTGRVPVLLNGSRADLILVFDNDHPYGYIAGARTDYKKGETDTVAKATTGLEKGDVIDFICDYYSYDGEYQDSYMLGEQMTYDGKAEISNVYIDSSAASATYLFTDIYCQKYWTPVIP